MLLQEVRGEQRQVVKPLAERRDLQHDHVQPVEQILAESLLLDRAREIDVGRRDHADIDLALDVRADRANLALLQHPQ